MLNLTPSTFVGLELLVTGPNPTPFFTRTPVRDGCLKAVFGAFHAYTELLSY